MPRSNCPASTRSTISAGLVVVTCTRRRGCAAISRTTAVVTEVALA
jgi:hypothetical protein